MAKLLILSIVIVSFGVPVWLSTSTQPRRALRRAQTFVFVFILLWVIMCLKWYPTLVSLK